MAVVTAISGFVTQGCRSPTVSLLCSCPEVTHGVGGRRHSKGLHSTLVVLKEWAVFTHSRSLTCSPMGPGRPRFPGSPCKETKRRMHWSGRWEARAFSGPLALVTTAVQGGTRSFISRAWPCGPQTHSRNRTRYDTEFSMPSKWPWANHLAP